MPCQAPGGELSASVCRDGHRAGICQRAYAVTVTGRGICQRLYAITAAVLSSSDGSGFLLQPAGFQNILKHGIAAILEIGVNIVLTVKLAV